jgi:hypothetical protein
MVSCVNLSFFDVLDPIEIAKWYLTGFPVNYECYYPLIYRG